MNNSDNLEDKAENISNAWRKVFQIIFDSIPKYYETDADGAVVKDANGNLVKKNTTEVLK